MRTMQTTNIMNKYHNAKIIRDSRIIEVDEGIYTKQKKDKLDDEQQYTKKHLKKDGGVETYKEVYERTIDFLNYLRNNYKDQKILVVTHGMIASYIEKIGERLSLEQHELKNYDKSNLLIFHTSNLMVKYNFS